MSRISSSLLKYNVLIEILYFTDSNSSSIIVLRFRVLDFVQYPSFSTTFLFLFFFLL